MEGIDYQVNTLGFNFTELHHNTYRQPKPRSRLLNMEGIDYQVNTVYPKDPEKQRERIYVIEKAYIPKT